MDGNGGAYSAYIRSYLVHVVCALPSDPLLLYLIARRNLLILVQANREL